MMRTFRLGLFAIFGLTYSMNAMAYDAEIDGVCYNLDLVNRIAEVTCYEDADHRYSGEVIVPASFIYQGTSYTVTSIGQMAFSNSPNLQHLTLPSSIKTIGNSAFAHCTSLKSVDLPVQVTALGEATFSGCTALTSVVIPGSIREIANETFSGCTALKELNIPARVQQIGHYAFKGCTGIHKIRVEDSPEALRVGYNSFERYSSSFVVYHPLFEDCPLDSLYLGRDVDTGDTIASPFKSQWYLRSAVLGKQVTRIGKSAFDCCGTLKEITIPEGVAVIGEDAFRNCMRLKNVYLPQSLRKIEFDAFSGCEALEELHLPDSVNTIGAAAFSECSRLKSFVIPSQVTSIEFSTFNGCAALAHLEIPSTIQQIKFKAFKGCAALTELVIPDGITRIEDNTFQDCSALTSVTLPASVNKIGAEAFSGCKQLQHLTLPEGITNIAKKCFQQCTSLQEITLPQSVRCIEYDAFQECASLKTVVVPEAVESIGENAFQSCTGLEQITLPKELSEIQNFTFDGCSSLKGISLPATLTKIGNHAFSRCTSLKQIVIPDKVTTIRPSTFADCTSLTTVTLPAMLSSLEYHAFISCSALTHILLPEGVKSIEAGTFYGCSSLKELEFPYSLGSIYDNAFGGCSSLVRVILPNGLTYLGNTVFANCSNLTKVSLGKKLNIMGSQVFQNCDRLEQIFSYAALPPTISQDVFSLVAYRTATLQVPTEHRSAYQQATGWKDFQNIINMPEQVDLFVNCSVGGTVRAGYREISGENYVGTVPNGDDMTFTFQPKEDYEIDSVWVNGKNITAQLSATLTYQLTLNKSVSVVAKFKKSPLLTIHCSQGGKVFWNTRFVANSTQTNSIHSGTEVTLRFKANREFETDSLFLDQKEITHLLTDSATYTFMMDGDHEVRAKFRPYQFRDSLLLSPVSANIGTQVVLPFAMTNKDSIVGFEFDLLLPEGVTVAQQGSRYDIWPAPERSSAGTHQVSVEPLSDGRLHVKCASAAQVPFVGQSGKVLCLKLNISRDLKAGNYPLLIDHVVLTDNHLQHIEGPHGEAVCKVASYTLGDVNNDNCINVADIACVAASIVELPTDTMVEKAADVNGDGTVDVTDIVCLVDLILSSGTSSVPDNMEQP